MNKVEYGFRNVWFAKITEESSSAIAYGTPKSFSTNGGGAISISLAPVGDKTDFYADDINWFSESTNQGYEGDLALTQISTDFKKDIMGMIEDDNGALIEDADATFSKFALGFEVQGNDKPTRTWYYCCSVSRDTDEHSTKEASTTPATKTLTITVAPRQNDRKVKVSMTKSTTNETAYNSFFSAVYEEVSE